MEIGSIAIDNAPTSNTSPGRRDGAFNATATRYAVEEAIAASMKDSFSRSLL
jgi:hypothetical protein